MPPGSDRCVAVMTPDRSRRSLCIPLSNAARSARWPTVGHLFEVGGLDPAQPGDDLVDQPLGLRRTRRSRQRLQAGTKPLELEHQRSRVLGVEQHQFGHGSNTNRAGVASPVDDRRLTHHQDGLCQSLLRARAAHRRQGLTQQCRQTEAPLDSFADVHHRPADVVDHRLGGHARERQHPRQGEVVRRGQERVALGLGVGRGVRGVQQGPFDGRQHHPGVVGHLVTHGAGGQPEAFDGLRERSRNGAGRRSATTVWSAPSRSSRRSRRRRCRCR